MLIDAATDRKLRRAGIFPGAELASSCIRVDRFPRATIAYCRPVEHPWVTFAIVLKPDRVSPEVGDRGTVLVRTTGWDFLRSPAPNPKPEDSSCTGR